MLIISVLQAVVLFVHYHGAKIPAVHQKTAGIHHFAAKKHARLPAKGLQAVYPHTLQHLLFPLAAMEPLWMLDERLRVGQLEVVW
jgi:hypothetical protein